MKTLWIVIRSLWKGLLYGFFTSLFWGAVCESIHQYKNYTLNTPEYYVAFALFTLGWTLFHAEVIAMREMAAEPPESCCPFDLGGLPTDGSFEYDWVIGDDEDTDEEYEPPEPLPTVPADSGEWVLPEDCPPFDPATLPGGGGGFYAPEALPEPSHWDVPPGSEHLLTHINVWSDAPKPEAQSEPSHWDGIAKIADQHGAGPGQDCNPNPGRFFTKDEIEAVRKMVANAFTDRGGKA